MQTDLSKTQSRINELDSLRGLFAFSVMISHYTLNYDHWYSHTDSVIKFSLGNFGVCAFFVISGYVITMSLDKGKGYLHFFSSRFSRLFPAYWVSIIATFTIIHIYPIRYRATDIWETLINFTMLQNFLKVQEVDGVYWSISIELIFYIFAALTLKWHQSKFINLYLIGLLLFQHLIKYTEVSNIAFSFFSIYLPYFILGFSLFKQKRILDKNFLIIILLCGVNTYLYNSLVDYIFILTIFILFKLKHLSFLNIKPLIWLGSISYPLYLCHQNIGFVIISFLKTYELHSYVSILIATLISLSLSCLIKIFVEDKVNIFFYRKVHKMLSFIVTIKSKYLRKQKN